MTPATVAHWIDQGHLKGHKTPTGRRRVEAADLVRFLRSHNMPVPQELRQGAGSEYVVVVDDDPSYLKAMVRTLERSELGVEPVEASNGVDALLAIGRVRPAVIVLDYRLPDLNAAQVIERLMEPSRVNPAEVVVVTGGVTAAEEDRLRRVGVRVILNKADGMPAVVDAIGQALQRRQVA